MKIWLSLIWLIFERYILLSVYQKCQKNHTNINLYWRKEISFSLKKKIELWHKKCLRCQNLSKIKKKMHDLRLKRDWSCFLNHPVYVNNNMHAWNDVIVYVYFLYNIIIYVVRFFFFLHSSLWKKKKKWLSITLGQNIMLVNFDDQSANRSNYYYIRQTSRKS